MSGIRELPDGGPSPLTVLPPQAESASRLIASSGNLARISRYLARDFLAELVRRERVHRAAVVFRDHKEVMEADPMFGATVTLVSEEFALAVRGQVRREYDTLPAE